MREENAQLRMVKELKERDYEGVIYENQSLYSKLENLENVFIGSPLERDNTKSTTVAQDYATQNLIIENNEMKRRIMLLE